MGALAAVVSGNTAWSKVQKALSNASPAAQEAFRGLKIYLANQALNPNLNVAFFSQADNVVAATGTNLGTGTAKVYGVYAKKGTVATASYQKIADEATGGLVPATWKIVLPFAAANEENFYINYNPTVWANGIGVTSTTTLTGATVSTGASTAQDGFVIYSV